MSDTSAADSQTPELDFFEIVELFPYYIIFPLLILSGFSRVFSYLIQRQVKGMVDGFIPLYALEGIKLTLTVALVDMVIIVVIYLLFAFVLYIFLDLQFKSTTFGYALKFLTLVVSFQFVGAFIGGLLSLLFGVIFFYNLFSMLSFVGSVVLIHYGMTQKTDLKWWKNLLLFAVIFFISILPLWLIVQLVRLLI